MVAYCPLRHCKFSKGEPWQWTNQIMQTCSPPPSQANSSNKIQQLVSLISVLLYVNSQFLLQPTVNRRTPHSCVGDQVEDGVSSLRGHCVPNSAFILESCKYISPQVVFYCYRARADFSILSLNIYILWPVILETAPVADLLIHRGQSCDLLTSCSAYLLFVLMFFPLLIFFHNW